MNVAGLRRNQGAVAVALLLAPVVVALVRADPSSWHPIGDHALLALGASDLPNPFPLLGPWSRYGFRHPGPALFVWFAPFARTAGAPGLLLGAAVLNALALWGCATVLFRRGGPPLLWLGTLLLLLLESALGGGLIDPWNPIVTVLPFTLVLLLAWSCLLGDLVALPWFVAAASFVGQSHLGYGPTLTTLGIAVIATIVARNPRRAVRPILLAGAVGALLWLPPAFEQLTGDPGNVAAMWDVARTPPAPTPDWGTALSLTATEIGILAPWLTRTEPIDAHGVAGRSPAFLVPVLAALGAAAWIRRRDERLRALAALSAIAMLTVWVALTRIPGPIHPYLLRWTWPIGLVTTLSAVWALVLAPPNTDPAAPGPPSPPGAVPSPAPEFDPSAEPSSGPSGGPTVPVTPALAALAAAVLAVVSAVAVTAPLAPASAVIGVLLAPTEAVVADAEAGAAAQGTGPVTVLVTFDGGAGPTHLDGYMEGMVAALTERGHRAVGPRSHIDRLGVGHVLGAQERPALHLQVAVGHPAVDTARAAGRREVARTSSDDGPVAVFVR